MACTAGPGPGHKSVERPRFLSHCFETFLDSQLLLLLVLVLVLVTPLILYSAGENPQHLRRHLKRRHLQRSLSATQTFKFVCETYPKDDKPHPALGVRSGRPGARFSGRGIGGCWLDPRAQHLVRHRPGPEHVGNLATSSPRLWLFWC